MNNDNANDNDDRILQQINGCLDRMDEEIRIERPGMDKLRLLVDQVESKRKRKNDIQFLAFLILAAFAVSFEALAFSMLSYRIFVIVQAAALVCFPGVLLFRRLIGSKRVEGL